MLVLLNLWLLLLLLYLLETRSNRVVDAVESRVPVARGHNNVLDVGRCRHRRRWLKLLLLLRNRSCHLLREHLLLLDMVWKSLLLLLLVGEWLLVLLLVVSFGARGRGQERSGAKQVCLGLLPLRQLLQLRLAGWGGELGAKRGLLLNGYHVGLVLQGTVVPSSHLVH